MMHLNTHMLKAKIMENGLTCEQLAQRIGMNSASLSRKMNKRTEFSIGEMQQITQELHLTNEEAVRIFLQTDSQ